jgi:class 3 adenylate cyclase
MPERGRRKSFGYTAGRMPASELVRELCHLDTACFAPLGERQLKGFAELVPVFRLEWRN